MNRIFKGWAVGLLMALVMAVVLPFQMIDSYAATAKIAFSDPSTKVGEEFSVTMKFTCTSGETLGDTKVILDYDASVLEFIGDLENPAAGKISVRTGVGSPAEVVTELKFKALKAGQTTIKIGDWDGYDNNGQALTMEREGSSAITIEGLPTSSNDAILQSLQISPGVLEPSFSPDIEAYTTTVGLDVDKLTISANPNNESAVLAVNGADGLMEGENTVTCQVTAQDGTTVKKYTITVMKAEGGASEAGTDTPEGETPPPVELEVLSELRSSAKVIRIVALPEGVAVPQGFKESSITISEKKVQGWTLEAVTEPQFCLFYAMNEAGEPAFYSYDISEQTIQRYFVDAGKDEILAEKKELAENYNSLVDDYQKARYIGYGLIAAIGVLVVIVLALLITRKSGGGSAGRSVERESRPQEPAARVSRGRKMSKEERYMMGEEEVYAEEIEEDEIPSSTIAATPEPAVSELETEEVLQDITENLAKEAAATMEEEDFEFFDLDEDDF